jgi:hypothetical protein
MPKSNCCFLFPLERRLSKSPNVGKGWRAARVMCPCVVDPLLPPPMAKLARGGVSRTTGRHRLVADDTNGVGAEKALVENGEGAALGLLAALGADLLEAGGRGRHSGGRSAVEANDAEDVGVAALDGAADEAPGAEVGDGGAGLDELSLRGGHGGGEESGEGEELHVGGWFLLCLS